MSLLGVADHGSPQCPFICSTKDEHLYPKRITTRLVIPVSLLILCDQLQVIFIETTLFIIPYLARKCR